MIQAKQLVFGTRYSDYSKKETYKIAEADAMAILGLDF